MWRSFGGGAHSGARRSIGGAALKRVNTVSTKIEDGGHFIPFDQNICRSKQDIKKR